MNSTTNKDRKYFFFLFFIGCSRKNAAQTALVKSAVGQIEIAAKQAFNARSPKSTPQRRESEGFFLFSLSLFFLLSLSGLHVAFYSKSALATFSPSKTLLFVFVFCCCRCCFSFITEH